MTSSTSINRALPEEHRSFFFSTCQWAANSIRWMIENRGGFAILAGLALVPSQLTCPNAEQSEKMIEKASRSGRCKIEKFDLPAAGGSSLKGVIFYPPDWNPLDRSRCVVYHNPNGMTVSTFFTTGSLELTPADIAHWARCPVIMYDYRGTGLSSGNRTCCGSRFRPTYASIVDDAQTVLRFALKQFHVITMFGTSLGGGVATASLARHMDTKTDPDSPLFAPAAFD